MSLKRSNASVIRTVSNGQNEGEKTVTVYESNTGLFAPLQPMGNGKMLVYLSGVSIWSLHCDYSTPSLLALSPDSQGGYYETESRRLPHSNVRRHMMWYTAHGLQSHQPSVETQDCDLMLTDYMALQQGLFLRVFEGEAPLSWRLSVPGYVRTAFVRHYRMIHGEAEALFCTIPAQSLLERGSAFAKEQNLTVYVCGNLQFKENGRLISFLGGKGYLLIADSQNPSESLKTADKLIMLLRCGTQHSELPFFREADDAMASLLAPIEKMAQKRAALLSADDPNGNPSQLTAKISDAASALLSMQADCGIILTDQWHPYATASDLPLLTAALLKLGCSDAVKKMIGCFAEQLGSNGNEERAGIPAFIDSRQQTVFADEVCNGASDAYFLLAADLYLDAVGNTLPPTEVEQLLKKMRKAYALTVNSLSNGVIPFSGKEACFEYGILRRDCIFQGSLEATAVAITAAERYIACCDRFSRRKLRDCDRYDSLLRKVRTDLKANFSSETLWFLNAPQLVAKLRRPRFIRGVCPICTDDAPFPIEERLELDGSGHYRCRRCMGASKRRTGGMSAVSLPIESIDATANVAFWMDDALAAEALGRAAAFYRREPSLPLRLGKTDALLWAAARRMGSNEAEVFRQALEQSASLKEDPRLELGALPCAAVEGREMKGAMCSSVSIAALLIAWL